MSEVDYPSWLERNAYKATWLTFGTAILIALKVLFA